MADKDDPNSYFEGFLGSDRGSYNGLSDDELSDAIARAAIKKNIDPGDHGVVVSHEVMNEQGSEVLSYQREIEKRIIERVAKTMGMSHAHRALVASGRVTPPPRLKIPAPTIPDRHRGYATEDSEDLVAINNEIADEMATRDVPNDLQLYTDFIRQVRIYDKWLRPLVIFMGSLWFSSAVAMTAPTTVLFVFAALFFGTYGSHSESQKAIEAESNS